MLQIEKEAAVPTPFAGLYKKRRVARLAQLARPSVGNAFSLLKYWLRLRRIEDNDVILPLLYLDILKRSPDPQGLAQYQPLLAKRGLFFIICQFYFSPEHRGAIARSSWRARAFWWAQRCCYGLWRPFC